MSTRVDIHEARYWLQNLLPLARRQAAEEAAKGDHLSLEMGSPIGTMQQPYLRIENVVGVQIYARFGGWYSDILLDETKLPPAAPSALGTPMKFPHRTRAEAEQNAVMILAIIILNSRKPVEAAEDDGKRYFGFFGLWLEFPAEADRAIDKLVSMTGFDPAAEPQHWLGRLDALKRQHFGDGEVTPEAFNALPEADSRAIWIACAIVWSRLGLLRYPNDPEGPPPT